MLGAKNGLHFLAGHFVCSVFLSICSKGKVSNAKIHVNAEIQTLKTFYQFIYVFLCFIKMSFLVCFFRPMKMAVNFHVQYESHCSMNKLRNVMDGEKVTPKLYG